MKKAGFGGTISTAAVCFIFWLLITGYPNIQTLIAGLIVSLCAGTFSARFFIHENAGHLWNPGRLIALIMYIPLFLVELTKANLDMAKRALGLAPIKPGIVKVPVELKKDYAQTMLANSITLTPGTITLDVAEQDDKTWYYIHWINAETVEPEEAGESIKGKLERGVRRIWE